jgi:formiminoglutamate deiminase
MTNLQRDGARIVMPGLATAHSHAFQRALRGRTQRRATEAGSFWSWRGLMYALATHLDADDIYEISRFAYSELAMSGVTAVGEFHYVHHAPDGQPYAERILLADAVIRAARDVGLRIALIRTAYFRAGYMKSLEPAQKRFCDPDPESIIRDVESLRARYADDPHVKIAVAAHSIRAATIDQTRALAQYAKVHDLPFHMHIAEQRAEIDECLAEYGKRPVELLAESGILSPNFVGIHATHLSDHEIKALGESQSFVCLCRTTERDLGDGLPQTADLVSAGVRLCVGVDSHAGPDAFEEIRAVELDDRSRTETRHTVADAETLLQIGAQNGYTAIGMRDYASEDKVYLNANDPSLAGISDDLLADAVIFGATPRAVDEVMVGGRTIVHAGVHVDYESIRHGYERTLRKLNLI